MASHFTHDNATAPNIVQAHTMYGSPVTATMRPDSHGPNIAPATWSTTPYVPPMRRDRDRGKKLCAVDECKAYPSTKAGGEYCIGHARNLGIVPSCSNVDCKAAPMENGLCYGHQPRPEVPADGDTE